VNGIAERSHEPLTDDHLRRLGEIARADRHGMFGRSTQWVVASIMMSSF
jgi:hypothetical protein